MIPVVVELAEAGNPRPHSTTRRVKTLGPIDGIFPIPESLKTAEEYRLQWSEVLQGGLNPEGN